VNVKVCKGTFSFLLLAFFSVHIIWNVSNNWDRKCTRFDLLTNLSDVRGILYHYVDMMEMPHKTMTCLKMYYASSPMVLGVHYFSNFSETLEHFNEIWIVFVYYSYTMINLIEQKKKV
jgi:hypothetical protein